MRFLQYGLCSLAAAGALALTAQPAAAGDVVTVGNLNAIIITGTDGVLRAGSPWGPGSTPSNGFAPVDDTFQPEFQQWNNGSFWWDQDPSVNSGPVSYELVLNQVYELNRFVMQADDNDTYRVEWWDGGAWQTAWDVPTVPSFGLRTRDSGILGSITTDRLRLSATGGDNYYGISEFQAFSVPEPASWALMIAGFGLAGASLRRRRRTVSPV